jgi:hypothetical protein
METTHTYTWGEFYETTRACDNYEEIKGKFSVFKDLEKAKTWDIIVIILSSLDEDRINWLNSPCLDGLVYIRQRLAQATYSVVNILCSAPGDYVETFKFLLEKRIVGIVGFELEKACVNGLVETVNFY